MRDYGCCVWKDNQRHEKNSKGGCLTPFLITEGKAFSERERAHFAQSH